MGSLTELEAHSLSYVDGPARLLIFIHVPENLYIVVEFQTWVLMSAKQIILATEHLYYSLHCPFWLELKTSVAEALNSVLVLSILGCLRQLIRVLCESSFSS